MKKIMHLKPCFDETEDAFILTNEVYDNTTIIYQLHGPYKTHIPIENRVKLWKWNMKTKEKTTLPTCEYPIYGATIVSNQLIVVVNNRGNDFYALDLSVEHSQWDPIYKLNYKCWKIQEEDRFCLPTMHKFGNGMFLKFTKKMHYYNPITAEYEMHKIPKEYRTFSLTAKVNNDCYCLLQEEHRFVKYNMVRKTWIQCVPNASDETSMLYFSEHQLTTTLKVYQDRFILVHYHYETPSPSWEYLIYDTKMDEWSGFGEWSRLFNFNGSDQILDYREDEKFGIWLGDHFLYYRSITTFVPVVATLVKEVKVQSTNIFDISQFLENWNVVRPIVLMRRLIHEGRAVAKENQVSVLMHKLMVEMNHDIWENILVFLLDSPRSSKW